VLPVDLLAGVFMGHTLLADNQGFRYPQKRLFFSPLVGLERVRWSRSPLWLPIPLGDRSGYIVSPMGQHHARFCALVGAHHFSGPCSRL